MTNESAVTTQTIKDNKFSLFLPTDNKLNLENLKNRKWKSPDELNTSRANRGSRSAHESLELPDGRRIPTITFSNIPTGSTSSPSRATDGSSSSTNTATGLGETSYETPAGVSEPSDRSMLAAAQRELAEETGYGGGEWRLLMTVSANPSTHSNLTHCFLATGVEKIGEQHLDPTEDLRVHLLTRAGGIGTAPHRPHPAIPDGRAAVAVLR